MKEFLSLRFPLESGIMTTIRLTTGGACSAVGLDLDLSEDCKVCVTEGLLLLMHAGFGIACVRFMEEEGLNVRLTGEEQGESAEQAEDEISVALLEALAGSTAIVRTGGKVSEISFRFEKK